MTQKTALVLSAILTAFVLVVGGGIIARVSQPEASPVSTSPTPPAADVNAQLQQVIQQREAQYRQLIDEANQRLAALNQQLTAVPVAQAAPARASAQAAPAPSAAPQIALSPDAARDIAIQASNFATMIRAPELVRFEGQVAYEVGFTRGVVYVDASTGAVLFNGAQGGGGSQPGAQPPASGGEHEDEHENEHESEHD